MMRFIRPFLETLPGVDIWGLISLLIFFGFFVTLIWWVRRMRPSEVEKMKNMPLVLLLLIGLPSVGLAAPATGEHWGMSDDNWLIILLSTAGVLTAMVVALFAVVRNLGDVMRERNARGSSGTLKSAGMGFILSVYVLSDGVFYGLIAANLFLLLYILVLLRLVAGMVGHLAPTPSVQAVEAEARAKAEASPAWWERIWQKLNAHVAIEEEKDILLNHAYDGIRELDNRLPPWWLQGFYLSVFVGILYLFNYHIFQYKPLSTEAYEQAMAQHLTDVEAYRNSLALNVDESSVQFFLLEERIKHGNSLFKEHCTVCHAQDDGGAIGPNFTDEYWLHGGTIQDVFKVIKYGVPQSGMRSWQKDLTPIEIQDVATYVMTLQGTTPAQPKAPQTEPPGQIRTPRHRMPTPTATPHPQHNPAPNSFG